MKEEKTDMLLNSDLYKFTGAIEHWLTTYHRGFWGLNQGYEEDWKNQLGVGDVIVLHASGSEYLEDVPTTETNDLTTGIIGMAVVGSLEKKDRPVWLAERQGNGEWPFIVNFSEIYWFGDTEPIQDKPVSEKSHREQFEELKHLNENAVTFSEMNERTGYQIPAQMSYQNIAQQEKLKPLLRERLEGQVTEYSLEEGISVDVDSEVPDSREEKYTTSKRIQRNSAFASRVKKIYGYQCAFCGAERYTPNGNPEVEAAHIKPVSEGGPDHPKNGIALCRLHHWAYDNGWVDITATFHIQVIGPEGRPEYDEFKHLKGQKIDLPDDEDLRPAKKYLK